MLVINWFHCWMRMSVKKAHDGDVVDEEKSSGTQL